MGKLRRGGYVFVTSLADHPPRPVHVYRDGKFVAKWDLERWQPMKGCVGASLRALLDRLVQEGRL
jgi:hypothetical protein